MPPATRSRHRRFLWPAVIVVVALSVEEAARSRSATTKHEPAPAVPLHDVPMTMSSPPRKPAPPTPAPPAPAPDAPK